MKKGFLVPNTNQSAMVRTSILHVMTAHKQDEFELERFWNLESIGIKLAIFLSLDGCL